MFAVFSLQYTKNPFSFYLPKEERRMLHYDVSKRIEYWFTQDYEIEKAIMI